MHRQNFSSQQQKSVQEYAVNQDSNQYHQQHQLQQQHHQQQAQQQRITRTEHTIRQVTQQRGQFKGLDIDRQKSAEIRLNDRNRAHSRERERKEKGNGMGTPSKNIDDSYQTLCFKCFNFGRFLCCV